MLNEEKVKSMTKAAAYEKGPEKKNIEIGSYFRGDYLGLHMVKSALAYTLAFAIIVATWSAGQIEEMMLMISRPSYLKNIIKVMVIAYVSGLVVYECIIYTFYSYRYRLAKKSLRGYDSHLKKIHKFYETQESADVLEEVQLLDEENTL